jgi:hypothetical protein
MLPKLDLARGQASLAGWDVSKPAQCTSRRKVGRHWLVVLRSCHTLGRSWSDQKCGFGALLGSGQQTVATVIQQHQGSSVTKRSSMKQGQHDAQATSEFRIGAIEFVAEPGGRGGSTAALGYQTDVMRAVGVHCPAKILVVLPSKRCEQPPTIIVALSQDTGSLLLYKLAKPTTHRQISASHGKAKRNLSYEELKRQQALNKEHAEAISQAKLCCKHWPFREKNRVLVVDRMVVGWV